MNFATNTASAGFEFGTANSTIYIRVVAGSFQVPPPPAPPKPTIHPCAVLGIPCDAPPARVKTAYRRLAKEHHPDLGPPSERERRTKRMAEINHAYELLVNAIPN